jgi:hypothetical protein
MSTTKLPAMFQSVESPTDISALENIEITRLSEKLALTFPLWNESNRGILKTILTTERDIRRIARMHPRADIKEEREGTPAFRSMTKPWHRLAGITALLNVDYESDRLVLRLEEACRIIGMLRHTIKARLVLKPDLFSVHKTATHRSGEVFSFNLEDHSLESRIQAREIQFTSARPIRHFVKGYDRSGKLALLSVQERDLSDLLRRFQRRLLALKQEVEKSIGSF